MLVLSLLAKPVKAFSDFTKDPMGEYQAKNAQQQNGHNKSNNGTQNGDDDGSTDDDGLKGK